MTQETHGTDIIDLQPPPKPSKAKFDAKAYHRNYYRQKLKGEKHCRYCDNLLGSIQSIRKHESQNLLCKVKRLEEELKQNHIKS